MSSDVKRTVEIGIKLTGLKADQLKGLADKFGEIAKSVQAASDSLTKLKTTIQSIKVPTGLDKTVNALKAFSEVKIPNVEGLAKGLKELKSAKDLPNLAPFVTELKKFNDVKLPNVRQIAKGLKELSASSVNMGDAGNRLRILQRNLKRFSDIKVPNIAALVSGLTKLGALDIGPIAQKIKELNKAIKDLDKAGHLSSFAKFASDLNRVSQALEKAQKNVNRAKATIKEFKGEIDNASTGVRTFGDRLQTYFQYRLIADSVIALKQAAVEGATAILEYDQALKDLQAITGATGTEVTKMGTKIKEVASTTKFSASEVAQGMRTLGQAGFTSAESIETMQAVSDLATGTLSDMSTTVDLVTTAMRVFRIESSQSATVADVFGNAVNRSKLTIDKLRTAMNYVGPVARDIGVGFKEMTAAMGLLANSGLRASTVGTGLRRVFAELADPSDKLAKAARAAGISLEELNPRTQGLEKVIQALGLVLDDSTIAFDIFGKRGAAAALALSNTGDGYKDMLETVGKTGTAAHMAAIQMEGLGVSFKNLRDKLGLLAITLGEGGIADIFRILIDVSRVLVDVLTKISETVIGNFILKLGIFTVSIYALVFAFNLLRTTLATSLFQKFIANMAVANTSTKAMIITLGKFRIATISMLGPIAIIVAAIAGVIQYLNRYKKVADEAIASSEEFGRLRKIYQDYTVDTASLIETSENHLEANKTLRVSLKETASGMTEISDAARSAANSINPLTGEIKDGGDALANYNSELVKLEFDKIVEAGQAATENIKSQVSYMSTLLSGVQSLGVGVFKVYEGVGNSILGLLKGSTDEAKKQLSLMADDLFDYSDRANIALDWSEALQNGQYDFQVFSDYINSLPLSGLTAQEEKLKKGFDALGESTKAALNHLIKTEQIDLRAPLENILKIAEASDLTEEQVKVLTNQVISLKKSMEGEFDSSLEKFVIDSQNASESVNRLVLNYASLGVAYDENEKLQIEAAETDKTLLASKLQYITTERDAAIAAGKDEYAANKSFHDKRITLEKEFNAINKSLVDNDLLVQSNKLKELEEKYDNTINVIEAKLKSGAIGRGLYAKDIAEAEAKHTQDLLDLINKLTQPGDVLKNTKLLTKQIKLEGANQNKEIELQIHKGLIARTEGNLQIVKNNEDTARKVVDIWLKAENDIIAATGANSDQSKRIASSRLDAESTLAKTEQKVIKEKSKILKIEQDHVNNLLDVQKKYASDIEGVNSKRVLKLDEIETKLRDKINAIQKDIFEKQQEYSQKRLADSQSLNADLASISQSTEDKIREIKQRGLSDSQKDEENEKVALAKIREASKLIAQAELSGDTAALARGKSLISQAESLASSLQDQGDAVSLLRKAETGLKSARSAEGAIAANKSLIKQQKEIAKNVDKIREAESTATREKEKVENVHQNQLANIKETADRKIQSIEDSYSKSIAYEGERHTIEVQHLDTEIIKYQEKLNILKQMVNETRNLNNITSSGSNPTGFASGGEVRKFADGGYNRKSNYVNEGSNSFVDSVKALLMKGEYIIKRSVVEQFGVPFFDALNSGRNPLAMAAGGIVSSSSNFTNDSSSKSESFVNIRLDLPVQGKPVTLKGSRTSLNELMLQLQQLKRLGQ